ncbi:MAG: hypothetical protein ACYTBJ_06345 [Planctomycetota bacterium]|jgi:hypothetical protein
MIGRLSRKDKRALKLGAVCAVAILVVAFGSKWTGHWAQVRKSLDKQRRQLKIINPSAGKREGLLKTVPVFEMPTKEEDQKYLFREKFNEQLKKAGIKGKPLQVLRSKKSPAAGHRLLLVKSAGKCKFGQALELLAALKENPYLVGIEEFKIACQPEKRKEFELDITVSTLVKSED